MAAPFAIRVTLVKMGLGMRFWESNGLIVVAVAHRVQRISMEFLMKEKQALTAVALVVQHVRSCAETVC